MRRFSDSKKERPRLTPSTRWPNPSVKANGKTQTSVALPRKASLLGLLQNRLVVRVAEAWTVNGTSLPAGALLSLDLPAATTAPSHLAPTAIFVPGPRETFDGSVATRDRLVVTTY
jgi:prolyl oligopeptidase